MDYQLAAWIRYCEQISAFWGEWDIHPELVGVTTDKQLERLRAMYHPIPYAAQRLAY